MNCVNPAPNAARMLSPLRCGGGRISRQRFRASASPDPADAAFARGPLERDREGSALRDLEVHYERFERP